MSNYKTLLITAAVASIFAAQGAFAGMVSDSQGNVGYDTAAECDAAVAAGTAKFYKPATRKAAALRKGEVRFQVMTLKEVAISQDDAKSLNFQAGDYKRGACDLGQSAKSGQNGVSKPLIGKYVPYSEDLPVNVYFNKQGLPVRISMKQCDNRFSANFPRPIPSTPVTIKTAAVPVVAVMQLPVAKETPSPVAVLTPPVAAITEPVVQSQVITTVDNIKSAAENNQLAAGLFALGLLASLNNSDGTSVATTATAVATATSTRPSPASLNRRTECPKF